MLLAYIVYIALMCLMVWSTGRWVYWRGRVVSFSFLDLRILFPVLLFTLIIGLRYNVGMDYESYYHSYATQSSSGMPWGMFEPAFVFLNRLLNHFHLPPYSLFSVVAFLQIVLFYKVFEDKPYLLSIAVLLLFLMGHVFGMMNILRHFIAAMIVLVGVRYASAPKTLWKFLLCVVCALLFHYSSLAALPIALLCLMPRPCFWDKRWLLLGIYLFVVALQEVLLTGVMEQLLSFLDSLNLSWMGKVEYVNMQKLSYAVGEYEVGEGSGYGRILNYLIVVGFILMNKSLFRYFGMGYLNYFRVYYVGQLLLAIAGLDMNLRRVAMFYSLSGVVVAAYFFYYVYSRWKLLPQWHKSFGIALFGYYLLLFFYKIYTGESACSPFQFVF